MEYIRPFPKSNPLYVSYERIFDEVSLEIRDELKKMFPEYFRIKLVHPTYFNSVHFAKRIYDKEDYHNIFDIEMSLFLEEFGFELPFLVLRKIEIPESHRRKGYGEKIVNMIYDVALKYGYSGLMIEHIVSENMLLLIEKLRFLPHPRYWKWYYKFSEQFSL